MKARDHILITVLAVCVVSLWILAGHHRQRIERLEDRSARIVDVIASMQDRLFPGVFHTNTHTLEISNSSAKTITVQIPSLNRKIQDIKWRHELNWDLQKNGIECGYLACRLGMSLSNYLAEVQAASDKLLEKKISEAVESGK